MKRTKLNRKTLFAMHALTGTSLLFVHGILLAQTVQDTTYRFGYDAHGNLTQIIDPLGRNVVFSYDTLHRMTQRLLPPLGSTRPVIQYGYDGLDQLISVTDPRNLITTYTINGLGNQTALSSPDTGTSNSTHDQAGNVLTHTDAKGQTTTYTYDALNRITRIAYADGSEVAYTYDQGQNGIGRLTSIVDISGTTQYAYDQHGRVLSESRTIGGATYTTAYAYDNAGRLSSITYPGGRIISYTRDGAGRISQIDATNGETTQTVVSQIRYRPFGGVQSFVNGAGQTITRSYDLDGRITSYTLRGLPQLINYDAASRIKFIADTAAQGVTSNYGYDNLDRLTQYNGAGASQSYSYDAVGNRTSKTLGSNIASYSYASTGNRLTQIDSSFGTQLYNHDANGSLIGNSQNQFSYDTRGRMIAATTTVGQVQYRINALGQRVQKITPDQTTVYHYDTKGRLIAESASNGTAKDYIYLDDMPVAMTQ